MAPLAPLLPEPLAPENPKHLRKLYAPGFTHWPSTCAPVGLELGPGPDTSAMSQFPILPRHSCSQCTYTHARVEPSYPNSRWDVYTHAEIHV